MESNSSFCSFGTYLHALAQTPARLARRAGSVSTSYEEMNRVRFRSGAEMAKTLGWYDLVGFGLGGMVGAGVFVTTGRASRLYAGPAVIVSYAIAGLCALLSAFCYSEFAVAMPIAGGAFSYVRVTFGELAAFLTGANLIMEYVVSNAAVARSFTAYMGATIGVSSDKLRYSVPGFPEGFNRIDLVAVAVILIFTVIICYSTRESSTVNLALTTIHVVFILFIIVMGFCKGKWKNLTEAGDPIHHPSGFFPNGAAGVFNGAAMVCLSYIGYDAVSTMAEEVKNPVKDIPLGLSGSVVLVTILYCLMAASMCTLLPYDMIVEEAPFSGAFSDGRSRWISKVIGIGASFGILTSLLVAMLGQARYMCVIGRSRVVPAWFAQVHPGTSTPINASAFLGILTATLALLIDLDILLDLVSIGTLFVFYMVANAVIYSRYVPSRNSTHDNNNNLNRNRRTNNNPSWPTISFLAAFSVTAILFTILWKLCPNGKPKIVVLSIIGIVAISILQIFHTTVPQARKPEFWGVPLMPHVPCASIFLNVFLLGSLQGKSYIRFGVFSAILVLIYVFYGVHASNDAEGDGILDHKNTGFQRVEESDRLELGGGLE